MTSNPMSDIDQVRENRAHADTFDKFTVVVAMGGAHVAIILSALALAFVAGLPLLALAWGVAAHLALALAVTRAWQRSPAPSLPGVLPETDEGTRDRGSVHVLPSVRSRSEFPMSKRQADQTSGRSPVSSTS
jgi:hypothetical protein